MSIQQPHIQQDTLFYTVYLPAGSTSSQASALCISIRSFAQSLLPENWIWHKDSFELNTVQGTEEDDKIWSLAGIMRVGDSIEDEWVVVWLLKTISEKWQDLIISVQDYDGQFLLIEASNYLPSWVTPQNSTNRLFLHHNELVLLPLSIASPSSSKPKKNASMFSSGGLTEMDDDDSSTEGWLELGKALSVVRNRKPGDLVVKKVQKAIWERIASYPKTLSSHTQSAFVYIPTSLALLLSKEPSLIQQPIESFYTSGPTSILKKGGKMKYFPTTPQSQVVLTRVHMTKVSYAQLRSLSNFDIPVKSFPDAEWRSPTATNTANEEDERRWRDLGAKITIGFESLYSESASKALSSSLGAGSSLEELVTTHQSLKSSSNDYRSYILNLEKNGFFGENEIEGSKFWKEREIIAVKGWLEQQKSTSFNSKRPSFAVLVNAILDLTPLSIAHPTPVDPKQLESLKSHLIVDPKVSKEDGEEWMMIDESQLNGLMMQSSGRMDVDNDAGDGNELAELAKKVGEFVNAEGGMEGALFDDEDFEDSDDEELAADVSNEETNSDDNEDGENPPLSKAELEQKRKIAMDNLVPSLGKDEWGIQTQNLKNIHNQELITKSTASSSKKKEDTEPVKFKRPLVFTQDKFDGIDSDDELSEEEDDPAEAHERMKILDEDEEADGEGDIDVDMGQEEEDFLGFVKNELGITEEMWEGILGERRERGAFVPTSKVDPTKRTSLEGSLKHASVSSAPETPAFSSNSSENIKFNTKVPTIELEDDEPKLTTPMPIPADPVVPGSSSMSQNHRFVEGDKNLKLDSFEAVMKAMDEALEQKKGQKTGAIGAAPTQTPTATLSATQQPQKKKVPHVRPKKVEDAMEISSDEEEDEDDIMAAMDAELREALLAAGDCDSEDEDDGEEVDYKLIKNFLESYSAQGGMSGPVGNLVGRLGGKAGKAKNQ